MTWVTPTPYLPIWTAAGSAPSLGNGTLVGGWKFAPGVNATPTIDLDVKLRIGSSSDQGAGLWSFSIPFFGATREIGDQSITGNAFDENGGLLGEIVASVSGSSIATTLSAGGDSANLGPGCLIAYEGGVRLSPVFSPAWTASGGGAANGLLTGSYSSGSVGNEITLITLMVDASTTQGSGTWSFDLPSPSTNNRTASIALYDASGGIAGTATASVTAGSSVVATTAAAGVLPVGGGAVIHVDAHTGP